MLSTDLNISISLKEAIQFFHPDEIIRLEADSNYTRIHFTNRKPLLVARVLKSFIPSLESRGFIRTHRTHLINVKHIRTLTHQGHLVMSDASHAEISRSRRKEVKAMLL